MQLALIIQTRKFEVSTNIHFISKDRIRDHRNLSIVIIIESKIVLKLTKLIMAYLNC